MASLIPMLGFPVVEALCHATIPRSGFDDRVGSRITPSVLVLKAIFSFFSSYNRGGLKSPSHVNSNPKISTRHLGVSCRSSRSFRVSKPRLTNRYQCSSELRKKAFLEILHFFMVRSTLGYPRIPVGIASPPSHFCVRRLGRSDNATSMKEVSEPSRLASVCFSIVL